MTLDLVVQEAVRAVIREELRAALKDIRGAGGDVPMEYSEAAELLGYHVSTITKWVKDGLLPAYGNGKGKRVYRADVLRALELSSKPKEAPTAQSIADNILAPRKLRRVR